MRPIAATVLLVAAIAGSVAGAWAQASNRPDVDDALRGLQRSTGAVLDVKRSADTGLATFLTTDSATPITLPVPAVLAATERASAFVALGGSAFGITDTAQVRPKAVDGPDETGAEHVRLQQLHDGVPVTGGELIVHLKGNAVLAVNGGILPLFGTMNVTPTIDAYVAAAEARRIATDELGAPDAAVSTPRLEIFDPGFVHGTPSGAYLTWYIDVSSLLVREAIWIDARRGDVVMRLNRRADAQFRLIFDADGTNTFGSLVRIEGDPATGDADADAAYNHAGDTYNYFLNQHGRASYDNLDTSLVSVVHFCEGSCPYRNAFWNSYYEVMVYGDGYSRADDVVAHELTHAVIDYSAGLFYCAQSGALNESFADIFGETVDLTNNRGTDTSTVRWLVGEQLPTTGAIRSMNSPNAFDQPARTSDPLYLCATTCVEQNDNGGVHINSGVPNRAYALMVDGGTYNGITVTGIGLTKAAKIQYRALTAYLTPFSQFVDAYHALNESCSDLIGIAGITAADCASVTNALQAVELNLPPCQPRPTRTRTPTRTPTRTATPPPTRTPTPTVTVTPTPTITRTPTPTITPTPLALPNTFLAKGATKCQRTIAKVGSKLVSDRLKALGTCANSALRCAQSKAGEGSCLSKAAMSCDKKLAALAASAVKRRAAIAKDCAIVGLEEMRIENGLGYEALAEACALEGSTPGSPEGIADCVLRLHACSVDGLLGAQLPRAGALLEAAGLSSERWSDLACLHRGTDGVGGDVTFAGTIERCASAIQKAGKSLVLSELAVLQKCTISIFACEQAKPGQFAACVQKAEPKCRTSLQALPLKRTKMLGSIQTGCGGLPFDALRSVAGINLDALSADCEARGVQVDSVKDYAECLVRQHECHVDDLLRAAVPRTDQLLSRVGLAASFPMAACRGGAQPTPDATPTNFPTATPVPSATAVPTSSPTATATVAATATGTPLATETPSATPSPTDTATPSETSTPTATETPRATETITPWPTESETPTAVETATPTPTPTVSPSFTEEAPTTPTPTSTVSMVPTETPTEVSTPSDTPTPVAEETPTPEDSIVATPTVVATETSTPIETVTDLPTPSATPAESPTAITQDPETPVPSETATVVDTSSFEPTPVDTPLEDLHGRFTTPLPEARGKPAPPIAIGRLRIELRTSLRHCA